MESNEEQEGGVQEGVLVHRFPFGLKSLSQAGVCDVSCARTFHEPHLPDGANGVGADVSGAWERPCAEQGTSTLTHEVHVILGSTGHLRAYHLSPIRAPVCVSVSCRVLPNQTAAETAVPLAGRFDKNLVPDFSGVGVIHSYMEVLYIPTSFFVSP